MNASLHGNPIRECVGAWETLSWSVLERLSNRESNRECSIGEAKRCEWSAFNPTMVHTNRLANDLSLVNDPPFVNIRKSVRRWASRSDWVWNRPKSMRSKSKECDPIGTALRPTGCEIGDYKLLIRNFLCETYMNLYEKNGRDDEREHRARRPSESSGMKAPFSSALSDENKQTNEPQTTKP